MPVVQEQSGQSTVEYPVLLSVALAVILALSALWHYAAKGSLIQDVLDACSHLVQGGDVLELLLY